MQQHWYAHEIVRIWMYKKRVWTNMKQHKYVVSEVEGETNHLNQWKLPGADEEVGKGVWVLDVFGSIFATCFGRNFELYAYRSCQADPSLLICTSNAAM